MSTLIDRTAGQFSQDPIFVALVELLDESVDNSEALTRYIADTFNLDKAEGAWLDMLGRIVGQSRAVPYTIAYKYFGFVGQPGGNPFDTYRMRREFDDLGEGVLLDDTEYRGLLNAVAIKNHGSETVVGITRQLHALTGSSSITVTQGPAAASIMVDVASNKHGQAAVDLSKAIHITSESAGIHIELTSVQALSHPAITNIKSDSIDIGVTTEIGRGVLYWSMRNTPDEPPAEDIVSGAGSVANGNEPVISKGEQGPYTISTAGLPGGTDYYVWFVQDILNADS